MSNRRWSLVIGLLVANLVLSAWSLAMRDGEIALMEVPVGGAVDSSARLESLLDEVRSLTARVDAVAQGSEARRTEVVPGSAASTEPMLVGSRGSELGSPEEIARLVSLLSGGERWSESVAELAQAYPQPNRAGVDALWSRLNAGSSADQQAARRDLVLTPVQELLVDLGKPARVRPFPDGATMSWDYTYDVGDQRRVLEIWIRHGLVVQCNSH